MPHHLCSLTPRPVARRPRKMKARALLAFEELEARIVMDSGLLVNQRAAFLAGVDQYLTAVENTIGIHLFQQKIPVIGNALAQITGANFVEQVRQQVDSQLASEFTSSITTEAVAEQTVAHALFTALGPGGLNVLQDPNGNAPTVQDVTVTSDAQHVQFNVSLRQDAVTLSTPIDFHAGFSALGLSVNGTAAINVNYQWQLGFGVDATGFYGDTSPGNNGTLQDFVITASAGLAGLQATGKLGIFQLDATDDPNSPTAITLTAAAGLTNYSGDDKFRVGGQTQLQFNHLDLTGDVNVRIPLTLSINGSDVIPRLRATLHFDQSVAETMDPGSLPTQDIAPTTFALEDIGINLGSFVTNFLRPATQFLDKPLASINWLIDDQPASVDGTDTGFFYSPLPLLSGIPFVNALTPRQIFGYLEDLPDIGPAIKAFDISIDALAKLNDFVKAVNASSSGGDIWINFGTFDLTSLAGGSGKKVGDTGLSATQTGNPAKDGESQAKDNAGSEDTGGAQLLNALFSPPTVNGPQFDFPILTDPFTVVNLLLGNYANVDLFKFSFTNDISFHYDLQGGLQNVIDKLLSSAPQSVQDTVDAFLNVLPLQFNYDILLGSAANPLHFDTHLSAGFDASGLAQFVQTGDPADILKGFFIGSGTIFDVGGTFGLGASVLFKDPVTDSALFTAHASGSLDTELKIGLNDPNNDGKLRLSEIEQIIGDNVSNIGRLFAVSGHLGYTYDAGFAFPIASWSSPDYKGSGTVFDFNTSGSVGTIDSSGVATAPDGSHPVTLQPRLATRADDGTLYLNIGPKASNRVFGDLNDDDENFTVTHVSGTAGNETVTVSAFGLTQTFTGVQRIVGDGGAGSNTITASGILDPMNFAAGNGGVAGDDTNVINLAGSSGPATITITGSGPATINGGNGDDSITTGSGPATITAGNGSDTISAGGPATISVGNGNDTITGGNTISTGNGNDTIHAAGGSPDNITTGNGNNTIYGGASGNTIHAGDGNTTVYGGAGSDSIYGGAGHDVLHGGGGNDTITTGATGAAQVYGDTGSDTITAHAFDTWIQGGSGGSNSLTIDTTAVTGTETLAASTFSSVINGAASTMNLVNVQTLAVSLGQSSSLTLNGYAGLLSVQTPSSGSDSITIAGLPASTSTVTFNLPNSASIDVQNTQAALNLVGGGSDSLTVDRSADLANETGAITATQITGLGLANITYSHFSAVTVDLGQGRNTLNVNGTMSSGTTTLNGGPDNDSFRVTAVGGGNTVINGGGGSDSVTLVVPTSPGGFSGLHFNGVRLIFDGSGVGDPLAWDDNEGKVSVTDTRLNQVLLANVSTLGATQTYVQSPASHHDPLTVEGNAALPQTVTMQGSTLQVQEGSQILSGNSFLAGSPTTAPVVTPAQVYTIDQMNALIDTYGRSGSNGALGTPTTTEGFVNTTRLNPLTDYVHVEFGYSIAVQGNWAVVGSGALAYVYHLVGGQWQIYCATIPSLTDGVGVAVALLAESNGQALVAVADLQQNSSAGEGLVNLYQLTGAATGTNLIAERTAIATISSPNPNGAPNAPNVDHENFGEALALAPGPGGSATLVVGAPDYDTPNGTAHVGAAFIYTIQGTHYTLEDAVFAPANASINYHFGAAVAVADNTVVVGAPSNNSSASNLPGSAYVYQYKTTTNTWYQATVLTAGTYQQGFGTAVAVFDTGTAASSATVFVGMPNSGNPGVDGSVLVYHESAGSWSSTPADTITGPGGHPVTYTGVDGYSHTTGFGDSIVVVGGQLAIGSPQEYHVLAGGVNDIDNEGAVRLYRNADPSWNTVAPQLVGDLQTPDDQDYGPSGTSIGFNGTSVFDAAILAPGRYGPYGSVYVFQSSLSGGGALVPDTATQPTNLYIANPSTSSVSVFRRDPTTGALTFLQSFSNGQGQGAAVGSTGAQAPPAPDGFQAADAIVVSRDDTTVYVAGSVEAAIAVFSRDTTTGRLTFASVISDSHLVSVTALAIDSTGNHLYVATGTNNSILVFTRSSGTWTYSESLTSGVQDAVALALSHDGNDLYAASQASSAIAIFARDASSGLLSYQNSVTTGQNGVDGLGGITALTLSPDGTHLFASGGTENSVAVFTRNTTSGALTFVQSLINLDGGLQGLADPTSLAVSPDGHQLYVGSAGGSGLPGGLATFQITENPPPPVNFNISYGAGISTLVVSTGSGNDHVSLGSMTALASVTINTGASGDTVVDNDTTSHQNVTIDLGNGGDTFDLRGTGGGSTVNVTDEGSYNLFRVWATGANARVTLSGGPGANTFRVAGTALGSPVTINGDPSASATGNVLEYDSQGLPMNPTLPTNPYFPSPSPASGRLSVPGVNSQPLVYNNLEEIDTLAPPVLNPLGTFQVNLGSSVTLSASPRTLTHTPGTYAWDLNNDGTFGDVTGSSVVVTWAQLAQLGINAVGSYPIWVQLTDAAGNVTEAPGTIQVNDVAPTDPVLTNSGPVTAGSSVTIHATATDPAGALDPLTYTYTFDDGTASYSNSTGVTTHTFTTAGNHTVGVSVTDAYGKSNPDATSTTVVVNPFVPTFVIISGPAVLPFAVPDTLQLRASGPQASAISSWTINWGDGTLQSYPAAVAVVVHGYATSGSFTIRALAVTPSGNLTSNPWPVVVLPPPVVSPQVVLAGAASSIEGSTYTLNLAVTPGTSDTITSVTVRWGDLTSQTVAVTPGVATLALTHAFQGGHAYVISAVATGQKGSYYANNTVALSQVVDVPPTLSISGPSTIVEGSVTTFNVPGQPAMVVPSSVYTLTLSAQASPLDPLQGWIVHWGDGTTQNYPGSATTATHVFAYRPTPYTISASAYDLDNSANNPYPASNTVAVTVTAIPPQLTIGGPASVNQGAPYQLGLRDFVPDGLLITGWTIHWGDGTTTVLTSEQPTVTHVYAAPSTCTISATATDANGTYSVPNTLAVQVLQVQPTVTINGPTVAVRGEPLTFTFTATDAVQAGLTYHINWGDNTTQVVQGTTSLRLDHAYPWQGSYTVQATVTDPQGGTSAAVTLHETVVPAAVLDGTLYIGGTPCDDTIVVNPAHYSCYVSVGLLVNLDGCTFLVTGATRIIVFGQAGDDRITIDDDVFLPAELYGGDGNDRLKAGGGPTILDGGAGNDSLNSGRGPAILIGGAGADDLDGGRGPAILIGGNFMAQSLFADRNAALDAVLSEWSSNDSYATRVSNLQKYLTGQVSDDNAVDSIDGGQGLDWFFARTTGTTKDRLNKFEARTETLTSIS